MIGTNKEAVSLWIDYYEDKYGDLCWDYNQYIFDLKDKNDLLIAIIQNQYYDEIDDLVYGVIEKL